MQTDISNNLLVHYNDYLGYEHTGYIVLVQECPTATIEGEVYVYIKDEDDQYNDKEYTSLDGTKYVYSEIRRSTEVWRDVDVQTE